MRALQLEKPGLLSWSDVPEPVPAAGEALVRVRRCGVCGTDIHAFAGRQPFFSYPRRLGHELVCRGGLRPRRRLSARRSLRRRGLLFLRRMSGVPRGKNQLLQKPEGARRAYRRWPRSVDDAAGGQTPSRQSLSPEQIALVEPLVIGAHGVERAAPKSGEPMVIIGLGPIGLAAAIFAKAAGANVACVDTQADRLAFACDTMHLGKGFRAGDRPCRLSCKSISASCHPW